MGNFREEFETYGADYETTMARFMGNEALYLRCLEMLFQDENLRRLGADVYKRQASAAAKTPAAGNPAEKPGEKKK